MSYVYDTMSKVFAAKIAPKIDPELAQRFDWLIQTMHDANHKLKDAVNHDPAVAKAAQRLEECADKEFDGIPTIGQTWESLDEAYQKGRQIRIVSVEGDRMVCENVKTGVKTKIHKDRLKPNHNGWKCVSW